MGTGPKPYPVVYDTDLGFQYVFESGNIQVPVVPASGGTITGDLTMTNDHKLTLGLQSGTNPIYLMASSVANELVIDNGDGSGGFASPLQITFFANAGTDFLGTYTPSLTIGSTSADDSLTSVAITPGTVGTVVISSSDSSAVASAACQINSITQGFLPPRLTTTQRDAIATPAEGLTIYNTTTHTLNFWNGSAWTAV